MPCAKAGCDRARQPNQWRGDKFRFCQLHKCTSPTCPKERDISPQGKALSWRYAHKCSYSSCNEPAEQDAKGCRLHHCQSYSCDNVTMEDSRHCYLHFCVKAGCPNERRQFRSFDAPDSDGGIACELHTCQHEDVSRCTRLVQDSPEVSGPKACEKHACATWSCPQPYHFSGSRQCRQHQCCWSIEDGSTHGRYGIACAGGAELPSSFCRTHKSTGGPTRGGCLKEVGKEPGDAFCDDHRCCYEGCRSGRDGETGPHCKNHAKDDADTETKPDKGKKGKEPQRESSNTSLRSNSSGGKKDKDPQRKSSNTSLRSNNSGPEGEGNPRDLQPQVPADRHTAETAALDPYSHGYLAGYTRALELSEEQQQVAKGLVKYMPEPKYPALQALMGDVETIVRESLSRALDNARVPKSLVE
ncbi:hypothetical protein V8F20_007564 [Naviculisporaceae sp. PSN 640]